MTPSEELRKRFEKETGWKVSFGGNYGIWINGKGESSRTKQDYYIAYSSWLESQITGKREYPTPKYQINQDVWYYAYKRIKKDTVRLIVYEDISRSKIPLVSIGYELDISDGRFNESELFPTKEKLIEYLNQKP